LKELDAAFGLAKTGNNEIAFRFYRASAHAGYDVRQQLKAFLMSVGRQKFVVPLYAALLKNPRTAPGPNRSTRRAQALPPETQVGVDKQCRPKNQQRNRRVHHMKRIAAAILIAFSATGAPAYHADGGRATGSRRAQAFDLEQDVNRVMKTFDVPGIAIADRQGRQGRRRARLRRAQARRAGPVDGQTLFEIASNSKAFTAAALAMLVDEGKLKWDDPVVKHLPGFQMYDAYVTREMTVRDLLTHRSGLGLGAGDLLWWPTTNFSTDEIIERLRYVKPATSFRSSYAYDNLLYIVAGKIIAQKSAKSWGDTVRERILGRRHEHDHQRLAENAGNPNYLERAQQDQRQDRRRQVRCR
jgi:hypothetical protein